MSTEDLKESLEDAAAAPLEVPKDATEMLFQKGKA